MYIYTDPCGCQTSVDKPYRKHVFTHKKLCEKHCIENDIEMVERQIRDLEERHRKAIEKYEKERKVYLDRLEQLKNE